jgi:hypothetical protein
MTNKNNASALIKSLLAGSVVLVGVGIYTLWDNSPDTVVSPEPAVAEATPEEPVLLPGTQQTEQGLDFDPEMKARLLELSDEYEKQVQYPDYSLPIDKEDLGAKYLPDVSVPNELPARLKDPNSPGLVIQTDGLRYFPGDRVLVKATITNLPETEASSVSSRILWNGEAVAEASVVTTDEGPHAYQLDFGTLQLDQVSQMTELMIHTEFQLQGGNYERLTSIEYVPTMAELDAVGSAKVVGEYLEIPVEVSTDKPGMHRIKGNLYDATTGQPLVHLRAEGNLESSSGVLVLKAHIAALKKAGSEGPYELKDLGLERMPSDPEYITEYGSIKQEVFSIQSFSFKEYTDKPYRNENSERIAKELRRLGS